jgi:2-amino-4-hydroxy-6-hydroxymethyldihydropteridine diphosphokinase
LIAFIALGSNLGDRAANLSFGIAELSKLGELVPSPLVMETDDESGTGQPYLNTVVEMNTLIQNPQALLEKCLRIELACGRDRTLPRNSPRTLDLDLIRVNGWIGYWEWDTPKDLMQLGTTLTLTLPHPRAASREFVIKPLQLLFQNRH